MSVGFVVMAHSDPKLLGALLRELSPQPTFLHIDKPALSLEYLADARLDELSSVYLNEHARCLHWGGYSILRAMLETLDLGLRKTGPEITHFAFLSGQCYPLRPVSEFVNYVQGLEKPILCRSFRLDGKKEMGIQRVSRRHWLDGAIGHAKKVGPRKLVGLLRRIVALVSAWVPVRLPELEHACGSQWTCLPRELAQEVVDYYFDGGFDYLKKAYAPDEVAIPTFVYNSRWKSETQVGSLESVGCKDVSAFPNFHWLRPRLQGDLSMEDLKEAIRSDHYFVRKLSVRNSGASINLIKSVW